MRQRDFGSTSELPGMSEPQNSHPGSDAIWRAGAGQDDEETPIDRVAPAAPARILQKRPRCLLDEAGCGGFRLSAPTGHFAAAGHPEPPRLSRI